MKNHSISQRNRSTFRPTRLGLFLTIWVLGGMINGVFGAPEGKDVSDGSSIMVYAAASTTDVVTSLSKQYEARTGFKVRLSFAASGTLARQIESGSDPGIFLSADLKWADYLTSKGLAEPGSRSNLLSNRLVWIVPKGHRKPVSLLPGSDLLSSFEGRLSIGDPASVPAGTYARESLTKLGFWDGLKDRLAPAENVRAALSAVALGETEAGIVFETDAISEPRIEAGGTFPDDSHSPIVYPILLTQGADSNTRAFLNYLTGPEARPVFESKGFVFIPEKLENDGK